MTFYSCKVRCRNRCSDIRNRWRVCVCVRFGHLGINVWYFNMLYSICGHTLSTKVNRRRHNYCIKLIKISF